MINVLAARALDPAGRGQLALAIQLSYVLGVFVMLGADRAYSVAADGTVGSRQAVSDLARLLRLPGAMVLLLGSAVGLALSPQWPQVFPYAAGIALLALANSAVVAIRTVAIVSRRTGPYLTAVVAGQALLLLACVALVIGPRVETLWWVVTYCCCIGVPAAAVAVREMRTRRGVEPAGDQPDQLARARALRWRLAPSAIAGLGMLRLDRLLIPWLASNRQLGLYIVVATMTELLYWPVQHYVDSHLPGWRRAHRAGLLAIRPVLLASAAYLAVAAGVVAAAVWLLIVPLFGHEYAESRSLVLPLVVAACGYGASRVGVGLSLATGHVHSPTVSDGAGLLVTFAGCVALIPAQGAMGAALASLLGYLTAAAVSLALCAGRPADPVVAQDRPAGRHRARSARSDGH